MAKIVSGLLWSAVILIFATCNSAVQSEESCSDFCTGWWNPQCCSRITATEVSIGYTCNYNCTGWWYSLCYDKNTGRTDISEQMMRCTPSWYGPSCNIAQSKTSDQVRMPPRIINNLPENIIFRSCVIVAFRCDADGTPDVRYEWKRNGFEIHQNLSKIEYLVDGTIIIPFPTSKDEGFYQCFARNQYGTAVSTMTHLQRAFLDSASGTPNVLQKTVQEGMPFHIQADPRKSFPKPFYGWEMAVDTVDKNSTAILLSKRKQIAENGDLYFAYALPEDNLGGRIYKSTTYNAYLDVKSEGSYTQLTVTPSPAGRNEFAPALAFSSEAQTVGLFGENVILRCFFSGYPEPSISWSGPTNTILIWKYSLRSFNTELTINSITASDEGDYVCTASNTKGRKKHTIQIRVEAAPEFNSTKDGPYDVNVTEGETVTFSCNAFAKPEATIVWLRNGQLIDINNAPARFVFSNDKKTLTIKNVCQYCPDRELLTDLMVIQCNASNVHGYAFASGYLNVHCRTKVSLPGLTVIPVDLSKENQFQFDCSATCDPSTAVAVHWYKFGPHGQELVYTEPPHVYVMNGNLTIIAEPNCTTCDKHLGEYRCVGDNGRSQDVATVVLNVTIPDAVPVKDNQVISFPWWSILVVFLCLLLATIGIVGAWYRNRYKTANTREANASDTGSLEDRTLEEMNQSAVTPTVHTPLCADDELRSYEHSVNNLPNGNAV